MSNLVALFGNNTAMSVPSYLAATGDSATNQLLGGLGEGRNRIGLKGARFRLVQAGQEVAVKDESFLDVVILGANASISRTFYIGKYDPARKDKPACYSPDGVAPAKDSETPQAAKCATCKQNEKGSKVYEDGTKGRACSFSKRLAVMLAGDPEQTVYQLDAKALSVFGDGLPSKGLYTLAEYAKLLGARGVRAEGVVTRISFDTDASVPKLYFTPQSFVSETDIIGITKLAKSPEVKSMLEVSLDSVAHVAEEEEAPAVAMLAQAPAHVAAPAPAPVEAPKKPKPAPAPAPAPEPDAVPPAPVAALPIDDDLGSMLDGLVD